MPMGNSLLKGLSALAGIGGLVFSFFLLTWPGMRVHTRLTGSSHLPHAFSAGAEIGTLRITAESEKATVPVDAESSLSGPSLSWKLFGRL